jgi:WhiB family redox-sensing transcriptional regulator
VVVAVNDEWRARAACFGADPELFFSPDQEGNGGAPSWTPHAALTICARCPVVAECRKWAIDTGQAGVWGGMTEAERRSTHRRATRRPSIDDTRQPRVNGSYTITPEDEARRRQLWKEGHLDAEIGAEVGRTTDVIREWRDRRGLKSNNTRRFGRTPKRVHELRMSLHQSQRTDAEIATLTKSTVEAIKHWRHKHGLTANRGKAPSNRPLQKVTA